MTKISFLPMTFRRVYEKLSELIERHVELNLELSVTNVIFHKFKMHKYMPSHWSSCITLCISNIKVTCVDNYISKILFLPFLTIVGMCCFLYFGYFFMSINMWNTHLSIFYNSIRCFLPRYKFYMAESI